MQVDEPEKHSTSVRQRQVYGCSQCEELLPCDYFMTRAQACNLSPFGHL